MDNATLAGFAIYSTDGKSWDHHRHRCKSGRRLYGGSTNQWQCRRQEILKQAYNN